MPGSGLAAGHFLGVRGLRARGAVVPSGTAAPPAAGAPLRPEPLAFAGVPPVAVVPLAVADPVPLSAVDPPDLRGVAAFPATAPPGPAADGVFFDTAGLFVGETGGVDDSVIAAMSCGEASSAWVSSARPAPPPGPPGMVGGLTLALRFGCSRCPRGRSSMAGRSSSRTIPLAAALRARRYLSRRSASEPGVGLRRIT